MKWLAFALLLWGAAAAAQPVAPVEYRRNVEQTFLTFPEWFLVHSPAEYASYVKEHTPSDFPFVAHIRQFWQGYGRVNEAIREYPFNFGYHVMIVVIGVSTSVEYAIRAGYEILIGRLSELTLRHGLTAEDRFGARVAQEYVDFIRVLPWYEFDFTGRLAALWRDTPAWGDDPVRKWERRYALTTEYAIKAVYGYAIKVATKASYGDELLVTAVVLDRLPKGIEQELPQLKVLDAKQNLILVPRYDAFMLHATTLAKRGANFVEIAGNDTVILVTILARQDFPEQRGRLFEQPILTRPGWRRIALVVPVGELAAFLNGLPARGGLLEHVYDY
jgi:hypothetical protein